MLEMDDLLDQLEEEVEKERRLKNKEQSKGMRCLHFKFIVLV